MAPLPDEKLRHFRYIDALRGIAFLSILVFHAGSHVGPSVFQPIVACGRYGVQLFFLLSAVTLLRSSAVRAGTERHPRTNFLLRRFFRIAPLFWFGMVLYLILNGAGPNRWAPTGIHAWQVAATATFLHGWSPTSIDCIVPGGWSIAAEMAFYLVLPFLWHRLRNPFSALMLTLGSLAVNDLLVHVWMPNMLTHYPAEFQYLVENFFYLWFPAQASVFCLGALLFCMLDDKRWMAALQIGWRPTLLLLATLYGMCAIYQTVTTLLLPIYFLFSLPCCLAVLSLAAAPNRLLVNRFTTWVGRLSYSCYITHFAALDAAIWLLKRTGWLPTPSIGFCVIVPVALALTVAISSVTFACIEQPGIRLGSALIKRWESRQKPTAAIAAAP